MKFISHRALLFCGVASCGYKPSSDSDTVRTVGGAVGGILPDSAVCLRQCALNRVTYTIFTSLGKSPCFIIIKVSVASLPLSRRVGVSQDATRAVKRVKVAVICRGIKETSSVPDRETIR